MADRASPASSPVAAAWPLVGRDAELERIALARSDGGCRGVVVSAESGVGKSRLAREAQTAAARDGAPRGLGPGDPQRGHRPARRVREPHRGGRALRRRPRAHAPQRRCARSTARPCGPSCRRSRARRLRAQLAAELRERDPLEPDDALRVARLLLDAGMELPSELLVDAARAANLAGDPELGAQLAPAALADGAGLPAALLLARAHTVRKRFADAEAVLAAVEGDVTSDDAGVDYLEQRCHVLFWGLYRTRETWDLLEIAGSWSDDADWQLRLGPLRLAYAAIFEGPAGSAERVARVLEDPQIDAATQLMTEGRLALSLFFTGRTKDAYALAGRVRPEIPLRRYSDAIALGLWRLLGFETEEDLEGLDLYMSETLLAAVRANNNEAAGHSAFSLGYTNFLRGRHRDAARW